MKIVMVLTSHDRREPGTWWSAASTSRVMRKNRLGHYVGRSAPGKPTSMR
jgi:hypothetical protein